ncbi:toxin biosynthesis protein [Rutstroemia sp. NJR-2017a BBW]|nr:toxin biosynthesis protein [Rutstroemia sp. NJR-2017a BBW]
MSSQYFNVFEHTIPCQHLREYPRSTRTRQEDVLKLAIKQYQPKSTNRPLDDAITIVATHANGFPKTYLIREQAVLRMNIYKAMKVFPNIATKCGYLMGSAAHDQHF